MLTLPPGSATLLGTLGSDVAKRDSFHSSAGTSGSPAPPPRAQQRSPYVCALTKSRQRSASGSECGIRSETSSPRSPAEAAAFRQPPGPRVFAVSSPFPLASSAYPRMGGMPANSWLGVMSRTYEIRSGRRTLSTRVSSCPLEAASDYARMFGSPSEIAILGVDTVMWRGAKFTAVPVSEPTPMAEASSRRTHSSTTLGSER